MSRGDVSAFFTPRSVAVIGVSATPGNLGRHIVENLLEFGFAGSVIPVGPGGGEVRGRRIVPNLAETPGPVELAVVLIPAIRIVEALEECGRAGVRAVVISSGGFGEYEPGRAVLERQILAAGRQHGFRIMGPNCIGVINLTNGLCLPFPPLTRQDFLRGPHSLISQSGGVMLYLAELFSEERVGANILISEGNKLDLDEADLIPYLAADPDTRVIFLYLEGIGRGRALLEAAAACPKPVVALKANVTDSSTEIARSHTAALAEDERVVDAAFRQAGILRVGDLDQFVTCAKAFALPPLRGDNLVIASMSGGISVVAADAAGRLGFRLPALPADFLQALERHGRGGVIHLTNPLDLGDIHDPTVLLRAVERLLALPDVHGMAVCLPSPAGPGRVMAGAMNLEGALGAIARLTDAHQKPVALSFFAGRESVAALTHAVETPIFASVTESIEALAFQRSFWRRREGPPWALPTWARPDPSPFSPSPGLDRAGQVATPSLLDSLSFVAARGMPVEEMQPARDSAEAVALAEHLGYPVAMKLLSPEVSHKTEVGGVALNLASAEAVEAAFRLMSQRALSHAPGPEGHAVGIQRMCASGHEAIVGGKRDRAFGPLVMFGLGGIWVEALDDVALRVAPIGREEAREMIGEIRGASLLRGFRGLPAADLDALVDLILAVSRCMVESPEIRELELNPVMVFSRGVRVVDARLGLEPDRSL